MDSGRKMIGRVEMRGIVKRFPGALANDCVDFDVASGEVHALLGENGAGKSTLMRQLYGMYRPDSGEIAVDGRAVEFRSPADAIKAGIGMIHQHFMLVPTLTVAQNVALGERSPRWPLSDDKRVASRVSELAESYGLAVDPSALVWQLSVGERQRVEIVKALYRGASLLILDEPTAVLTPGEVEDLFKTLRRMASEGHSLIFISHKLGEVMDISDRVTVLRDGRGAGSLRSSEATREGLVRLMVGRELKELEPRALAAGPVKLRVSGLRAMGDRGTEALRGIDLELRSGEILGLAGVSGNGQKELAECLAGMRESRAGGVFLDDRELTGLGPAERLDAGMCFVPEERMADGAIGDFSVQENLFLREHAARPYRTGPFLRFARMRERARQLIDEFAVKTPSLDAPLRTLSGGNIQKLILARELSRRPSVIIAAQPSRGVDVGATRYIHSRLLQEREAGAAILLVSEDLDEIRALSDRIAVIYEGRIAGILPRDASVERIGLMMAGSA
jgi:general nucleoside transport system ATP-binding protein